MQQHVHAGQFAGGDVLLLTVDPANTMWPHVTAHIKQQRAGTAGKVEPTVQMLFLACGRLIAVQGDDGR